MPRASIITELKSLIQSHPHLKESITRFEREMELLKEFYQEHEHQETEVYISHARKVFRQWSIQELFLFLALFGKKNLARDLQYSEDHPTTLLENRFIFRV